MRSFWYPRGYQILLAGHILHANPRIDGIPQPVIDVGVPGLAQQQVLAGQHGQRRKRQQIRHDIRRCSFPVRSARDTPELAMTSIAMVKPPG